MEAFPLHWPSGYKRNHTRIRSRFKITMDQAQKFLHKEVSRLGGSTLIVSTNIPIRKDGMLYADWMNKRIDDSGVAIYFKYKGKDVSMCCDQYEKIWENIYALGKGIEALRGMDRWGVSDFLDRVFTGFIALPEKSEVRPWYSVLGISENATIPEIKAAYRRLLMQHHPDKGGDPEKLNEIQTAQAAAMADRFSKNPK